MLYSILNPKYIIPVVGEYRHQFMQKKIAMNFGYSEDNVILLDNGEMIIFKRWCLTTNSLPKFNQATF